MIIGDPSIFAIESRISEAYERLSFRALGLFVIYINGRRYGVYKPDATMLACSFDEVKLRIDGRGSHSASFASEPDAGKIADALHLSVYAPDQDDVKYFGITAPDVCELIHSKNLQWTPDGDEAFDDGSYLLQFDVEDRVRVIAFRCGEDYLHDPATLSDVWLMADDFYAVLQLWLEAFESEWASMPKISDKKGE